MWCSHNWCLILIILSLSATCARLRYVRVHTHPQPCSPEPLVILSTGVMLLKDKVCKLRDSFLLPSTLNACPGKEITFNPHFHQLFSPFSKKAVGVGVREIMGKQKHSTGGYPAIQPGTALAYTQLWVLSHRHLYKWFVLLLRLKSRPDSLRWHSKGTGLSSWWASGSGQKPELMGLSLLSTDRPNPVRGEQEHRPGFAGPSLSPCLYSTRLKVFQIYPSMDVFELLL